MLLSVCGIVRKRKGGHGARFHSDRALRKPSSTGNRLPVDSSSSPVNRATVPNSVARETEEGLSGVSHDVGVLLIAQIGEQLADDRR